MRLMLLVFIEDPYVGGGHDGFANLEPTFIFMDGFEGHEGTTDNFTHKHPHNFIDPVYSRMGNYEERY